MMRALMLSTVGVGLLGAAAVGISTAMAQDVEPWQTLLQLQLEETKKCSLAGTMFVREMPTSEGVIISGRAKCFDGREFDFSQSKPHMKFDIKACDPTYC